MGKIPQGILGGVSGKVGGIVGTSWKGINVIKTKPLSVANPRTAGQIAQRTKFGNITKFASLILASFIKPLWDRFASRQSGYNAFISENISLFADGVPTAEQTLIASKGKMTATEITSGTYHAGSGSLDLEWRDDSGDGYKLADDVPFVCVFKPGSDLVVGKQILSTRTLGECSQLIGLEAEVGDVVSVYLAFRRADGTIVSDSSKLNVTVSS